jgi:hypothetical protein
VGGFLKKRQAGLSQEVIDIGWKAQQRLCKRYQKLSNAGKNKGVRHESDRFLGMQAKLDNPSVGVRQTEPRPQGSGG